MSSADTNTGDGGFFSCLIPIVVPFVIVALVLAFANAINTSNSWKELCAGESGYIYQRVEATTTMLTWQDVDGYHAAIFVPGEEPACERIKVAQFTELGAVLQTALDPVVVSDTVNAETVTQLMGKARRALEDRFSEVFVAEFDLTIFVRGYPNKFEGNFGGS